MTYSSSTIVNKQKKTFLILSFLICNSLNAELFYTEFFESWVDVLSPHQSSEGEGSSIHMGTDRDAEKYRVVSDSGYTNFYYTYKDSYWIAGSSFMQIQSFDYYSDSKSLSFTPRDASKLSGEMKDTYGTLYTSSLDLSNTSNLGISFKYLVTDSEAKTKDADGKSVYGVTYPEGYVSIEMSEDGGDEGTFESLVKIPLGEATTPANHYADLDQNERKKIWKDFSYQIPSTSSKNVIVRIKTYIDPSSPKAQFNIDELQIDYSGAEPQKSVNVVEPISDATSSSRNLIGDISTFDSGINWGFWEDGGRNIFTTSFMAENQVNSDGSYSNPLTSDNAANIGMRYRYVEGESNGVDDDGVSIGEHKPTYSSIVTRNMDLREYKDLEIDFSFMTYGMELSEGDYFKLSISTNSGVDYVDIKTWVVGEDFVNLEPYRITTFIPGDVTPTGRLTTTTKIKIQTWGQSLDDVVYLDNIALYGVGTGGDVNVSDRTPDWDSVSQDSMTLLAADTDIETYHLINSKFIQSSIYKNGLGDFEGKFGEVTNDYDAGMPGVYGAIEHTDLSHEEFGKHITQDYDSELGKDVFSFHIHQHSYLNTAGPDTDRSRTDGQYDDRQRMEIKGYTESPTNMNAKENKTHFYSWKMKIPEGFLTSDKFTHLHQLKSDGSVYDSMPLITLTAVAGSTTYTYDVDGSEIPGSSSVSESMLNIKYSPTTASQVIIDGVPISDLEGKWVHIIEKLSCADEGDGVYELRIMDANDLDGDPIFSFFSDSLATWKGGDIVRPKWGIYRSIVQAEKLRNEEVKFADFLCVQRSNTDQYKFADLISFGKFANSLSPSDIVVETEPIYSWEWISDGEGNDEIYIKRAGAGNVRVYVNGKSYKLNAEEASNFRIVTGGGNDKIVIDSNAGYGALTIESNDGNDIIVGGSGDDTIDPGLGTNTILGGGGNDTLVESGGTNDFQEDYGYNDFIDVVNASAFHADLDTLSGVETYESGKSFVRSRYYTITDKYNDLDEAYEKLFSFYEYVEAYRDMGLETDIETYYEEKTKNSASGVQQVGPYNYETTLLYYSYHQMIFNNVCEEIATIIHSTAGAVKANYFNNRYTKRIGESKGVDLIGVTYEGRFDQRNRLISSTNNKTQSSSDFVVDAYIGDEDNSIEIASFETVSEVNTNHKHNEVYSKNVSAEVGAVGVNLFTSDDNVVFGVDTTIEFSPKTWEREHQTAIGVVPVILKIGASVGMQLEFYFEAEPSADSYSLGVKPGLRIYGYVSAGVGFSEANVSMVGSLDLIDASVYGRVYQTPEATPPAFGYDAGSSILFFNGRLGAQIELGPISSTLVLAEAAAFRVDAVFWNHAVESF